MKEFNYVIIGGGCAGLSLAYELEINNKINNKTLAIIEPREEYKRDKTWSFWKVAEHNFDDCIIKSWNNFSINSSSGSNELKTENFPYQSIDSGLYYKKITTRLSKNKNIQFFKNIETYSSAGKIHVSALSKIIETFLSFFDFLRLFFTNSKDREEQKEHIILHKEINLDERI